MLNYSSSSFFTSRVYIEMEYVPECLANLLSNPADDRSPFITDEFLCILRDIASALKYIHELKIVHCDVKPRNVLLSPPSAQNGPRIAKLCDFGNAAEISISTFGSLSYPGSTYQLFFN